MSYRRFKPQTVAVVATVARAPGPYATLARVIHTAKFNNNNNININCLRSSEAVSSTHGNADSPAPICVEAARAPATLAKVATLRAAADYHAALAAFRKTKPYAATRLRHEQACWAAEMFLYEWESLAVEFKWTTDDIFASPCANRSGLAYWLGTDIVTVLGPEHAATEINRVFDRVIRQTWVNPYATLSVPYVQ